MKAALSLATISCALLLNSTPLIAEGPGTNPVSPQDPYDQRLPEEDQGERQLREEIDRGMHDKSMEGSRAQPRLGPSDPDSMDSMENEPAQPPNLDYESEQRYREDFDLTEPDRDHYHGPDSE